MKIKNIITAALLLISSFSLTAAAQEISEVEIRGNISVPQRQISDKISLKAGDQYSPAAAGRDLGAIHELDKFDDVSVSIEDGPEGTVRVIYTVREKPRVEDIIFKGNEEIRARVLRRKLDLEKNGFFDEFLMRKGSRDIELHYREEGFADARVEVFTSESEKDGAVTVTYFVEEGHKIEVKNISILGVVQENYRRVSRQFKLKEGKVFQQHLLDEGLENILTYYRNSGYLNAVVADPVISFDPGRTRMYVTIHIDEGSRYRIKGINFSGNEQVEDGELSESVSISKDDIYSDQKIERALAGVHEVYGKKGYIRMMAEPGFSIDEENAAVTLDIRISEGPRVYVRNIYVDGNFATKDYVIRREIDIAEGEPFDLEKVRQAQSRIFRTGFFSNVRIDMLPAGTSDKTDLVFLVDEQKTGMASLGAGYSSEDRLVGTVRISQDNLFGRGQRLSALWEFGARKQNYRIDFYEPWLLDTPTPFGASVYNTVRQRYYRGEGENRGSYNERRSGGSLSLGRHFSREFTAQLRYSLEQVGQYDIDAKISGDILELEETTSSITPSLSYDTRDFPFDPNRGYYLRISNQIAGGILGGDNDFMKTDMTATYFQPIFWRVVGVLNLNAGSILTYGGTAEVPYYERFNVGGAESVRGYEYYGDIGPAGGGNFKLVGNLELKFPLISEQGQTVIQGAVFYDFGGSWKDGKDIRLSVGTGENDLKRGFGVGIRFKMPGFPIRLDWGYGIDKDSDRQRAQWYFTLGDIFY